MEEQTSAPAAPNSYREFCQRLELEGDVVGQGEILLGKILALGIAPDTASKGQQVWWACAVFVVALEKQLQGGSMDATTTAGQSGADGLKLALVLETAGVRLNEFLDHLTLLTQKLELADSVNQAAASIKQDLNFTFTIFEKYQQLWLNRNRLSGGQGPPILQDSDPVTPVVFAFGWCLYALCKKKFDQGGLVESFHMMLACLDFSIRFGKTHASAPADGNSQEAAEASQSKEPSERQQMESMEEDAIAALTLMSSGGGPDGAGAASLGRESKVKMDVLEADAKRVRTYVQSLVDTGVLQVGQSEGGGGASEVLAGIFHPSVVSSNLTQLRSQYALALTNVLAVDEQQFVLTNGQEDGGINYPSTTPVKPSSASRASLFQPTPRTAPRQLFQDYSEASMAQAPAAPLGTPHKPPRPSSATPQPTGTPVRTPHRQMHFGAYQSAYAQTPVTAAIDALQWINSIEGLPTTPSARLMEHYSNATPENPQAAIEARISTVMEKIQLASDGHIPALQPDGSPSPSAKAGARDDSVNRTRRLGTALYYKVLQTMLDRETERLKSKDHGALFQHDVFQRALLACCVEVVLKALSLVTLAFPKILELFDIQAFDLYKVIESFVRCAPSLPYLLRQHLHQLEDQMLERVAWSRTQPGLESGQDPAIFVLIREARERGVWPVACLVADTTPDGRPQPQLARAKVGNGEALANGTSGQQQPRRTTTTSLDFFFRKVLKLAAERINALARRLEVGLSNTDQIWTVFKHCMVEHVDLLMPNRHLDHIILCSLYAICKVNKVQPEVTFKRIIDNYRKLVSPNSAPLTVIRDIELRQGRRGDIIRFYNDVYIPTLKNYILQFQRHHEQLMAAQKVQSVEAATALATGSSVAAPSSPLPTNRSAGLPPESPMISPIPITSPMRSPTRINSSNVFLTTASPNRPQGVMYREMTPRTRVLYAFGESPAKDLDLINRAVNKRPAGAPNANAGGAYQSSAVVPQPGLLGRSHKRLKM